MSQRKTFDDELAPLLKQMISVCQAEGISMFAVFDLHKAGQKTTCGAVDKQNPPEWFVECERAFQKAIGEVELPGVLKWAELQGQLHGSMIEN